MADVQDETPADTPALTNAQLTKEVMVLRRLNNELYNQVQNLIGKITKLDRDIRMLLSRKH
jgi:hypothetical protein